MSNRGRTRDISVSALATLALCLTLVGCGRSGDGEEPVADQTTPLVVTTLAATSSTTVGATQTTTPPQLTYVIQAGDSLSIIAQRFEIPTQQLADFNSISDPNSIKVGQELRIPRQPSPPQRQPLQPLQMLAASETASHE